MNKFANAFAQKNLITFITAGDPTPQKTVEYILTLEKAGAGMIVLGVPFSDPTAEGAYIQESNIRALAGGMNLFGVFNIMTMLREKSNIPVMLSTYANPIFQYGYDKFFENCKLCGVDAVNISDMQYEERFEVLPYADANGIPVISVVAAAKKERIQKIAKDAKGFIRLIADGDPAETLAAVREVSDLPVIADITCPVPVEGSILDDSIVRLCGKYGENAADALAEYLEKVKSEK